MRNKIIAAGAALGILSGLAVAAAKAPELPPLHKKWLEEEAVYIITSVEKDVFLKLGTDRERDLFIEAFWKQRDPTPSTPENEFKTEHYRRIKYANQYLGRETPKPGWMTDRGRVYIILGEAQEIQRYTAKQGIYDTESWFYQGKTDIGLPAGFYVLFFKESGHGEFKLYSPTANGPMALLSAYNGDPSDYLSAYEALKDVDPMLADISLSLVPGESSGVFGRPSLASDMLIQRIEQTPQKQVQERYARKFLQYKDIVEVEYTANYLDSDSLIKVFRDPTGTTFVHYAIEPKRLSVNQYENKYYTTLKLNGTVTTPDGKIAHQFEKDVTLDINEEQMKSVSVQPFDIQDIFPLVPGEYRLSILVKNEVSKEFTSLEQALLIPAPSGLQISQPLLGYKAVPLDPGQKKLKAFKIGSTQVYCQPNRVFTRSDPLVIAFQVFGLGADLRPRTEIRMSFFKDDQPFKEIVKKAEELPNLPDVVEETSLQDFPPAHYRVRVSCRVDGSEAAGANEEFDLTYAPAIVRPWFHARVLPEPGDPVHAHILGSQLFNMGRYDEARVFLEKAYRAQPESQDTAVSLARADLALGRFQDIESILSPFLKEEKAAKYEVYLVCARALQGAGEYARAIELYDLAVTHYGVNINLLNSIGDCYLRLGKTEEALAVWERSLQASPDQPEIKRKVEALKKK